MSDAALSLEFFEKSLPGSSASFMQVTVGSKAMQQKALAILAQVNSPRVDLLEVAFCGGKPGSGEIIKMIENLIAELNKAQKDNYDKRDICHRRRMLMRLRLVSSQMSLSSRFMPLMLTFDDQAVDPAIG